MKRMMIVVCVVALFAAGAAQAQILVNGDFEQGIGGQLSDGIAVPAYAPEGWFVSTGASGWHQIAPPEAVQGTQSIVLWGPATILAQQFAITPDTTYDISLDAINNGLGGHALSTIGMDLVMYMQSYDAAWGYLDGVEVARFESGVDPDQLWTTIGDQYTTPAGAANGQIYFIFEGANYTSHISIDNAVVAEVPEPATMALLGLGGLALRRRKK